MKLQRTLGSTGLRLGAMAWLFLAVHWGLADGGTVRKETPHWAYAPLRPVRVPELEAAANPGDSGALGAVDRFVRARLRSAGLKPALPADRRALLRRVTFDLTGLPPTPAELQAFLSDTRPGAYERVVDRLLGSPRYGERWARHWMDAAHFAETHGHDQDRIRPNAWPYRDYLIRSFNEDKPYGRFVAEQVAGDVLWPTDPQATVALGFVAAGPWDESSLRDIREDTLDRQIGRYLDRDDMLTTVLQTFTSTTVQCARCHDHKFDSISQADYYALQAVFAGVDRANRVFDPQPDVHRKRRELLSARARLDLGDTNELARLDSETSRAAVRAWEEQWRVHRVRWEPLPVSASSSTEGATLAVLDDGSLLSTGRKPDKDTVTILSDLDGGTTLTTIRLEVLEDAVLPKGGPGRSDNGNLHLTELEVWAAASPGGNFRRMALRHATADFNQEGWGIGRAIDGDAKTAWGIYPEVGKAHEAAFEFQEPLTVVGKTTLMVVLHQRHGGGHLIGRMRLSATSNVPPVRLQELPEAIAAILPVEPGARSVGQWRTLARHVERQRLNEALAALPSASLVYAAASDFIPDGGLVPTRGPRAIHVLRRGEITKPEELASPGTMACIAGLPSRFAVADGAPEGERRAALARWLSHTDNALVWRSIVNRMWHWHFGRGLVETPNDFGKMGAVPTHPELLDWLAIWFRDEARGSLKQLNRLLVTSAVYCQRADLELPEAVRVDADNRWLWRMNRSRLDAEQLRDAVLSISGRLDLRMGGPSDQQFDLQPGIHVTPLVDYTKFNLDSALGRRRSAYRFLFRTLPDPFMDALDCPAGDQLTAVRNVGVTVQQALALWNNAFMARHAEHLANRLRDQESTLEGQVAIAGERLLARPFTAEESDRFKAYASRHGLANLCRLWLNTNEFLFVN